MGAPWDVAVGGVWGWGRGVPLRIRSVVYAGRHDIHTHGFMADLIPLRIRSISTQIKLDGYTAREIILS